ncbi:MAG: hypothetical protein ABIQ73_30590 [Acidimicrobiales bacterium]
MRRALALIVAIGMVVGAVVVRRAIDDDPNTSVNTTAQDSSSATGKVLCASDLGDVCASVRDAFVEDPAVTVERLAKGEPLGADVWIVAAAWPQIALERAGRLGNPASVTVPATPIARTPLAFFLRTASADSVRNQCGTTLDWKCLLKNSASVRFDFEDPSTSITGLLAVIQQATAFYGSSDFGSNDFRLFDRELAQLKAGRATAPSGATVFERFGLFSHADALAGLTSVGSQQLQRAQFKDKLVTAAGSPSIAADVVIAITANPSPIKNDDVRSAFNKAGWATSDLGSRSDLPTADVIIALQDLWKGLR